MYPPVRLIEAYREHHIVVAGENVLHLCPMGVYHVAGAVIAPGEAAFSTPIEAHIGQRQDV